MGSAVRDGLQTWALGEGALLPAGVNPRDPGQAGALCRGCSELQPSQARFSCPVLLQMLLRGPITAAQRRASGLSNARAACPDRAPVLGSALGPQNGRFPRLFPLRHSSCLGGGQTDGEREDEEEARGWARMRRAALAPLSGAALPGGGDPRGVQGVTTPQKSLLGRIAEGSSGQRVHHGVQSPCGGEGAWCPAPRFPRPLLRRSVTR